MNCEYFNSYRCRSCSLLAQSGDVNLSRFQKLEKIVEKTFGKGIKLESLFTPESIFPSRARAKLSVSGTIEEPVIGLLDKEFKGIELCSCPLHFPEINEVLRGLPSFVSTIGLRPYDIKSREGELKGLILRLAADRSSLNLRFVLRSRGQLDLLKRSLSLLLRQFSLLKVVSANIQPVPHQIVEGEEEIALTENIILWEQLGKYRFAFQPRTFSQVTPEVALELYSYVEQLVSSAGSKSVLDLYCGVGGFSIFVAKHLVRGLGVEVSCDSIDCANLSAKENAIGNIEFIATNVESFMADYQGPEFESVIINPPRRGVSPAVLDAICKLSPRQIVYSSCNRETLLRDIKKLENCFQLKSLKPFDMFPLTEHLEVVAELRRSC